MYICECLKRFTVYCYMLTTICIINVLYNFRAQELKFEMAP